MLMLSPLHGFTRRCQACFAELVCNKCKVVAVNRTQLVTLLVKAKEIPQDQVASLTYQLVCWSVGCAETCTKNPLVEGIGWVLARM